MREPLKMFSEKVPGLQLAWDATSLGALMKCPRYYQYSILEGFRGSGVDLEFGILAHKGKETYEKERAKGATHEAAQLSALEEVFENSFVFDIHTDVWAPWGGAYVDRWHCTGTVPFKNAKGNRAKCPYSHKGAWFETPGPATCSCGSPTEVRNLWLPNHKYKDRYNLMRWVWAYTEAQKGSPLETLVLDDGKPAVEMSFKLELPFRTSTGEQYWAVGYIDSVKTFGDEAFITDLKTTKNSIGSMYYEQFSPNVQMDWYAMGASFMITDRPLGGVIVEAAQLLTEGVTIADPYQVRVDAGVMKENLAETQMWLDRAEEYAKANYWPKNRSSCFLCKMKAVCNASPDRRQAILEGNFERNRWDPTKERT